ncbi:MAG: hypothetical protein AB1489_30625, partial [Acidobacteriota bacterium]
SQPPKLAIPYFDIPKIQSDQHKPRVDPKGEKELRGMINKAKEIEQAVNGLSAHIMQEPIKEILVFVDDERKAEFNTKQTNTIRLSLNEDSRLIKVVSHTNGKLSLLAAMLLNSEDIGFSWLERLLGWRKIYRTTLESGQQVTFKIGLSKLNISNKNFIIDICYQESRVFQDNRSSIWTILTQPRFLSFRVATSFITATVIVCLTLWVYFNWSGKEPELATQVRKIDQNQVVNKQKTNSLPQSMPQSVPQSNETTVAAKIATAKSGHEQKGISTKTQNGREIDIRTLSPSKQSEIELASIERIYIDPFGDSPLHEELNNLLKKEFTQGKIDILTKRDLADAVLQGSLKESNGKLIAEVELVNRSGKILFKERLTSDKELTDLAAKITYSLLEKKEKLNKQTLKDQQ